jgi:branched-chain amino acid transport system ATP-binding protein
VILDVKNISLRFGGVKALTDISFNVREHEIRSIIGPNGAGKSSMLNCINGVYTPRRLHHLPRPDLQPHEQRQVAEMGIARTFQNLALFKGMSVLDNIMTGRNLKIRATCCCRRCASARPSARKSATASSSSTSSTSSKSRPSARPRGPAALRPAKARGPGPALAMEPQVLLLDEPMAGMNVEESRTCAASSST